MGIENKIYGFVHLMNRKILGGATSPFLPAEVIYAGNGLERARKLQKEGRNLIVMSTLPSATDQPREYPLIWGLREFQKATFHVPTAYHILNDSAFFNLAIKGLSAFCGIEIYSIVTQDTVSKGKNCNHKARYGNIAYARATRNALRASGGNHEKPEVVFLTPSAGIRTSLRTPPTKAAELLLTIGGGNNTVLLMGVEINNVRKYSEKTSGMNIFKKYTIRVGDAYTDQELIEVLNDYRQREGLPDGRENRPFAYLDQWLFNEAFVPLVPREYL